MQIMYAGFHSFLVEIFSRKSEKVESWEYW